MSAKVSKILVTFLSTALIFSSPLGAEEDEEIDTLEVLFREKGKAYPGCVFIVKDELQYIDEDKVVDMAPLLLDTCIRGRSIGEKRMRKMYEIDPEKDKPRKKNFSIRLVPLHEMNDERNILYREN